MRCWLHMLDALSLAVAAHDRLGPSELGPSDHWRRGRMADIRHHTIRDSLLGLLAPSICPVRPLTQFQYMALIPVQN